MLQLYNLEDFFEEDDIFFVYGSERINVDDFELDFEGMTIYLSTIERGNPFYLCCVAAL